MRVCGPLITLLSNFSRKDTISLLPSNGSITCVYPPCASMTVDLVPSSVATACSCRNTTSPSANSTKIPTPRITMSTPGSPPPPPTTTLHLPTPNLTPSSQYNLHL